MVDLDLSSLEKLTYRGFDTDDKKKFKDDLINQGYTIIVEDIETPLECSDTPKPPAPAVEIEEEPKPTAPAKKKKSSFFCGNGEDYNKLYRAAHDFHMRHNPPSPDLEYWSETSRDMGKTSAAYGNHPFLMGLLKAIFEELERNTEPF